MRTQGSLRLILNTKLWPQMQVDKASEKSVRITAMDTEDQGVKVFLISVCIAKHGQGLGEECPQDSSYSIIWTFFYKNNPFCAHYNDFSW